MHWKTQQERPQETTKDWRFLYLVGFTTSNQVKKPLEEEGVSLQSLQSRDAFMNRNTEGLTPRCKPLITHQREHLKEFDHILRLTWWRQYYGMGMYGHQWPGLVFIDDVTSHRNNGVNCEVRRAALSPHIQSSAAKLIRQHFTVQIASVLQSQEIHKVKKYDILQWSQSMTAEEKSGYNCSKGLAKSAL